MNSVAWRDEYLARVRALHGGNTDHRRCFAVSGPPKVDEPVAEAEGSSLGISSTVNTSPDVVSVFVNLPSAYEYFTRDGAADEELKILSVQWFTTVFLRGSAVLRLSFKDAEPRLVQFYGETVNARANAPHFLALTLFPDGLGTGPMNALDRNETIRSALERALPVKVVEEITKAIEGAGDEVKRCWYDNWRSYYYNQKCLVSVAKYRGVNLAKIKDTAAERYDFILDNLPAIAVRIAGALCASPSIAHNDLSARNIFYDGSTFWLGDWEKAKVVDDKPTVLAKIKTFIEKKLSQPGAEAEMLECVPQPPTDRKRLRQATPTEKDRRESEKRRQERVAAAFEALDKL